MTLFSLNNVNFKDFINYKDITIIQGGATFICGESGAGKSTLLKLLNGVISPTAGEIHYLGKNIEDYDSILLRREILLISQSAYLFDMSIEDNFREFYAYRDLEPPSLEIMKSCLDICSLHLPLDTMCNVMSGGERQRAFIAIHLSFPSKVVMLDEPTSALDEKNADFVIENIKSYCKENEKTLIIVSHDKSISEKYADFVIDLK